jgi:hypothetical protein
MKIVIIDNTTRQTIDVTHDVADILELGLSPAWTDALITEGVDIAASIARSVFGHDDINAGTTSDVETAQETLNTAYLAYMEMPCDESVAALTAARDALWLALNNQGES